MKLTSYASATKYEVELGEDEIHRAIIEWIRNHHSDVNLPEDGFQVYLCENGARIHWEVLENVKEDLNVPRVPVCDHAWRYFASHNNEDYDICVKCDMLISQRPGSKPFKRSSSEPEYP